jgi:hypothetical protein
MCASVFSFNNPEEEKIKKLETELEQTHHTNTVLQNQIKKYNTFKEKEKERSKINYQKKKQSRMEHQDTAGEAEMNTDDANPTEKPKKSDTKEYYKTKAEYRKRKYRDLKAQHLNTKLVLKDGQQKFNTLADYSQKLIAYVEHTKPIIEHYQNTQQTPQQHETNQMPEPVSDKANDDLIKIQEAHYRSAFK